MGIVCYFAEQIMKPSSLTSSRLIYIVRRDPDGRLILVRVRHGEAIR